MNDINSKEIIKIGFLKNNFYNIWNDVINIKEESSDYYNDTITLNMTISLSDVDIFLDIENKDFLFVKTINDEVYYIPIIEFTEKAVEPFNVNTETIAIESLKLKIIVINKQIKNNNFIWLENKHYSIVKNFEYLDILNKTITINNENFNKTEELYLHIKESLMPLSYYRIDNYGNKKERKLIKYKMEDKKIIKAC